MVIDRVRCDRDVEREVDAAKAFALRQEAFSHEVIEQKTRLQSIGLYKQNGESKHTCPLCNHGLDNTMPTATKILQ